MACRRCKRRRAFGLRPVPASRHGHPASIPHAFAPAALRAPLAAIQYHTPTR
ncbi:hypothetical protein CSC02_4988 (plasmid) [Enterobacter hormaechei subsp. hoffmannii]|nr:hypothetical protein CSC02_4988 [Enterobacter hormaechei subsp. hoffmannii]